MAFSGKFQAKVVGNSSLHPFTFAMEVSEELGLFGIVSKLVENIEFIRLDI